MQSKVDMSKMQSKVDMTIRGTAPVAPGRMLNKVDMTIRGTAPVAPGIRGTSPAAPALNRLTMMTSGVPTKAAVTAVSTFGMGPSTIGGMPGMAPLAPALQEPGEQQGEMLVVNRQEQEVQRQPEAGDRRQRMEMERKGNVYLQICIGGTGAVALGLLLLILILPKGQLPTSAITTELSETDYPTPPVTTTTTTTTTTTPTTTVTTTLPPAGPPEIACFYDISNIIVNKVMFDWTGANICKDIHVRMTVLPTGAPGDVDNQLYWKLAFPNDHIYFMYFWEEIHGKRDLGGLKTLFDNKMRRYSLGWLNSTHLSSVDTLQAFVDVFKSDTIGEDSGISLGLNLNEDKIQQTRGLLSRIGSVSPKFTVLLIKLEDHGGQTCQLFPYSMKNKIQELTNAREWPAPVALPVTAAIYKATSNASGDVCVSFDSGRDQWYCPNTTDDSVFRTNKGKLFAAENRKSLKELKRQYRDWRTPRICILQMEFFYFRQSCMTRNESDFIL